MVRLRLPITLALLLFLGGAAALALIQPDDDPLSAREKLAAKAKADESRRPDRSRLDSQRVSGPQRQNRDDAARESNDRGQLGTRPDAPDNEQPDGTNTDPDSERRTKVGTEIGDAVDQKAEEAQPEPKPEVKSSSPVVVAAPAAPAPNPTVTIRNLLGDPTGLSQTRQGHVRPGLRRLRAPEPGTVPTDEEGSRLMPGLLAEYFKLEQDPRHLIRIGANPSALVPADHTRIDENVYFPNRASFRLPVDGDNMAARWRGYIRAPAAGNYFIGLGTDVAGAVVIDGQVVILNDVMAWYVETWAQVSLTAGWHRIEIQHIEGPQPGDGARNMACVFQWKEEWEKAAKPVPKDWFAVPESLQPPQIVSVNPPRAEVGTSVTINGERFVLSENAKARETDEAGLFKAEDKIEVFFDSVPAGDVQVNGKQITCVIPPGAGSGVLEVRRGSVPSNQFQYEITTSFGLVLSVWDLTGYPKSVEPPQGRLPDYVVLDDTPFPLTRDKFAQFEEKPVLVRLEGLGVAQLHPAAIAGYPGQAGTGADVWFDARGVTWQRRYGNINDRLDTLAAAKYAENSMGNVELLSGSGVDGDYPLYWVTTSINVLFDPAIPAQQILDHQATFEHHADRRMSHFKPSMRLPAAPHIDAMNPAGTKPSARVGAEVELLVDVAALAAADPVIAFSVDDVATQHRPHEDATVVARTGADGRARQLRRVWVAIPDGAGEGMVRARRGIVQSKPVEIDVANRGLVGMYYDFDEVLRAIPDMRGLTPLVRRVDKHMEFQNGTDFKLPFAAERFSAEWFGSIRVPEGGEYTFVIQSDDGSRLKIGNQVVVEFPGLRPPGISTGKITLTAGWHDLHIEFFENDVLENMVMWWIPPGAGVKSFIPLKHLSTDRHEPVPNKWPTGQLPTE